MVYNGLKFRLVIAILPGKLNYSTKILEKQVLFEVRLDTNDNLFPNSQMQQSVAGKTETHTLVTSLC